MSDFSEINAIVKRRYETGEYGNAHFKVPVELLDEMRRHVKTSKPGSYPMPHLPGYSIGDLMGIPVLVDEDLPEGMWRLVDNSTGAVVHEARYRPVSQARPTTGGDLNGDIW